MTRDQRLRELVEKWTSAAKSEFSYQEGQIDARNTCATELEAILNEENEGWLPIESAPTSGIAIIVSDGDKLSIVRRTTFFSGNYWKMDYSPLLEKDEFRSPIQWKPITYSIKE